MIHRGDYEHLNFDLVPSHKDMELARDWMDDASARLSLKTALEELVDDGYDYDFILIDCPPDLSVLTDAAFIAAQNVAALKRAHDQDLAVRPGQDIKYVVVDDEKRSQERVRLAHEEIGSYDPSYYETELVRAVESLLSPLEWDRSKIHRELAETRVTKVSAFTETDF